MIQLEKWANLSFLLVFLTDPLLKKTHTIKSNEVPHSGYRDDVYSTRLQLFRIKSLPLLPMTTMLLEIRCNA